MNASIELLLISAARDGEFTVDANPYGFAWKGRPVDSHLGNLLTGLYGDGLLDYDTIDGAAVRPTEAGGLALLKLVVGP